MAPIKKSKLHKCNYTDCRKVYTSVSNLNNHIRVKHVGVRWICPYCDKVQVAKDSHDRHIRRNHPEKWTPELDLDQNQFADKYRANRTGKAKDALIKTMQKTIDKQCEQIVKLQTKLADLKQTYNIESSDSSDSTESSDSENDDDDETNIEPNENEESEKEVTASESKSNVVKPITIKDSEPENDENVEIDVEQI